MYAKEYVRIVTVLVLFGGKVRAGTWIDHPCEVRLEGGPDVVVATAEAHIARIDLLRCDGTTTTVWFPPSAPTDLLTGVPFAAAPACYERGEVRLVDGLDVTGAMEGESFSTVLDVPVVPLVIGSTPSGVGACVPVIIRLRDPALPELTIATLDPS